MFTKPVSNMFDRSAVEVEAVWAVVGTGSMSPSIAPRSMFNRINVQLNARVRS